MPLFVRIFYDEFLNYQHRQLNDENLRTLGRMQSCGIGVRINGRIFISQPRTVCLGNNVHIGENAFFRTEGGLTIGDNTHISRNVSIYTVNHDYMGRALPYDDMEIPKPVAIGKNVWIARGVSIVPGVRIGNGAVIGMGACVTRDIPPLAVAGGNPAEVVKYRETEHYQNLSKECRYGGANGVPLNIKDLQSHYLPLHDPRLQLFFVVTTGRSGSLTISKLLSQHPRIKCDHEPRPQLIRLSTEFAHGSKSLDQTKNELIDIYCNSSAKPPGMIYGECDHRFFNLITILAEIIPTSKFIWLIRDGKDVVASTWGRGWFGEDKKKTERPPRSIFSSWAYYRIDGVACGEFDREIWDQLSAFEKNCWYWYYVNTQIKNALNKLSAQRFILIKAEEMAFQQNDLFNFLSVSPIQKEVPVHNIGNYPIKKWECWNAIEKNIFFKRCGKLMDEFYPEWRTKQ